MLNDKKVRKKVACFDDLSILQKAVEFAKEIYLITEKKALKNDFRLKNQMRDSAVSISSNIAEEFERRSRKKYLGFLNIANASAFEIRSQLFVAFEVSYIEKSELEHLTEKAKFLSGAISNRAKAINIADI